MAVTYADKQGKVLEARGEAVLLATGRKAATEGLFEPGAEPVLERGAVVTNAAGLTSIPHLYAIGDVRAHTIQLAHDGDRLAAPALVVSRVIVAPRGLQATAKRTNEVTNELWILGLSTIEASGRGIGVEVDLRAKLATDTHGTPRTTDPHVIHRVVSYGKPHTSPRQG